VDTGWLLSTAEDIQFVLRVLDELETAHTIASDPSLRRAVITRATTILRRAQGSLEAAAESTPIRDLVDVAEDPDG